MSDDIIESWKKNAVEWIRAIDLEQIGSRRFTNDAIVEVLKSSKCERILDVGCGEGWLTRNITNLGKHAVGLDAIAELLLNARQKGPGSFYQMGYEEIMTGNSIPEAPYDMAVFNFSLYQEKGLPLLFENIAKALSKNGSIVVHTLHPYFLLNSGLSYQSQVVDDSWKGLKGNFQDGHSWYARTFEEWFSVFAQCNMKIIDLKEVINGEGQPISVILRAVPEL